MMYVDPDGEFFFAASIFASALLSGVVNANVAFFKGGDMGEAFFKSTFQALLTVWQQLVLVIYLEPPDLS